MSFYRSLKQKRTSVDISTLAQPLTLSLKSLKQISRTAHRHDSSLQDLTEHMSHTSHRLPKTLPQTTQPITLIQRSTTVDLPETIQTRLQQMEGYVAHQTQQWTQSQTDINTLKLAQERTTIGLNTVQNDLSSVKQDLNAVQQSQGEMQTCLGSVKQDLSHVKQDLTAVRQHQGEMQTRLGSVKQDLTNVNQDLTAVQQSQEEMQNRLGCINNNVDGVKRDLSVLQSQTQSHWNTWQKSHADAQTQVKQVQQVQTQTLEKLGGLEQSQHDFQTQLQSQWGEYQTRVEDQITALFQTTTKQDVRLTTLDQKYQQKHTSVDRQTQDLETKLGLTSHTIQDTQDKLKDLEDEQNVLRLDIQSTKDMQEKTAEDLLHAMNALKQVLVQAVSQSTQQQKQWNEALSEHRQETRQVVNELNNLCQKLQQNDQETLNHIKELKSYTEGEVKTLRQHLQNQQTLQDNIEALKSKYQQLHAIMLTNLESVSKRQDSSAETIYSQMKEEAKKLEEMYRQQQNTYQTYDATLHAKLEQMETQLRQRLQQMETQINTFKMVDLGTQNETLNRTGVKNVADKIRKTSQNTVNG